MPCANTSLPFNRLSPEDSGICKVLQHYAVFQRMTVFENIGFGLRMQKLPYHKVARRGEPAAGLMHIEQQLKRHRLANHRRLHSPDRKKWICGIL